MVALYPESVAGRLSVPRKAWVPLYGGPKPPEEQDSSDSSKEGSRERPAADLMEQLSAASTGTIRGRFKGLGSLIPSALKDDDAVSITGKKKIGLGKQG